MKRGKFSLSNTKLLSCNTGQLVPIGLTEVLPGDTIQMSTHALVRMAALLAPVMHPLHARIHHWYVPHRLVWDEWEDFITGGPAGTSTPAFPTRAFTNPAAGGLHDYLGMVPGINITASILPFRGYQLIWNEWYRDQDLQTAAFVSKASGNDVTTNTSLQTCAWEKDYFTSARPFEQKGPAVTVPLGTSAPVLGIGTTDTTGANAPINNVRETQATRNYPFGGAFATASNDIQYEAKSNASGTWEMNIRADLTGASAITVNLLREALALQRFEEARARYGSRYTEYLRYLGVRSSDARLQRPEYLGGGKQVIQFSEVLQTAEGTDAVGTMRGHGIAPLRSNRYRRFIEEHGYIFTLLSLRPKTIYAQGLFRHWNRRTKEDYWQRELQFIGQQEVLNKEVYEPHSLPDGIFGYQDRYDEYRRQESSVSGEFRTSLNFWHMARIFASDPALNSTFVSCVPSTRNFAVTSANQVYVMANHSIQARRLVAQTGRSMTF